MKTLLAAALLLTSLSAFSMRIPLPTCEVKNGVSKILYQDPNHFFADFCINHLGIANPVECVKYQGEADQKLLEQEMLAFLKARISKVCGK